MSDSTLRLQGILKAVDKLNRTFRSTTDGSKALSVSISQSRRQLVVTGDSLDTANKNVAQLCKILANGDSQTAQQIGQREHAMRRMDELQNGCHQLRQTMQRQNELLNASRHDPHPRSGAQGQKAEETRPAPLSLPDAPQARAPEILTGDAGGLTVRDRLHNSGERIKAFGFSLGSPIWSSVKIDAGMETAMKGVTNEVKGLLDKSGHPNARYQDLQAAIKDESERQPVEDGAVGYAALVAEAASNRVANPQDSWEDQKRALLDYASQQAQQKASGQGGLVSEWAMMQTSFDNVSSSLGEPLRQPLTEILQTVRKITGSLRHWIEQNPQLVGTLVKMAAGVAAIAVVFGGVLTGLASVLGPLALMRSQLSLFGINGSAAFGLISRAVGGLGQGILGLGRIMLANPILAIIGLIAMAAFYIWQNWDQLGPKFQALWDSISHTTSAVWGQIQEVVNSAWQGIQTALSNAWQSIQTALSGAWEGIRNAASAAWILIQAAISTAWEEIKTLFFDYTLPGLIAKNWDAIKAGVLEKWESIQQAIRLKWQEIKDDFSILSAQFKDIGSAIIDNMLNGINEKWQGLRSKLSSVTRWWQGEDKPSTAAPTWQQPALMYDGGGQLRAGQIGIVGENGPEIINGPANITSRRRTAALASVVAGMMGVAAAPADAAPLHPLSLPAKAAAVQGGQTARAAPVVNISTHAPIAIYVQPGQNPQDIAQEVARQLAERERSARSQALSNLRDQEGYDL